MNFTWPDTVVIVGCVFIISTAICLYRWIETRK